ncbi:Rv1733c family protein [Geodermatophilus sp. SYSU D00698]
MDGPLDHPVRSCTPGSGPLERGTDRLQVLGRLAVVLALPAAAPLAVTATTTTRQSLEAQAETQAAERHRGRAVLLEDAPAALDPEGLGDRVAGAVPARATWPAPGGLPREGVLQVRPHTPAGTAVSVWVDGAGRVTREPMDPGTVPAAATAAGVLALVGVPLAAWTLHVVLCGCLDARRDRRWTEGWAAVEREWSTRR